MNKPFVYLVLGFIAIMVLAAAGTFWQSASVDLAQAQAQIETAKAAQEAARAAQITGAGLAVNATMSSLTLYALPVLALAIVALVAYIVYARRHPVTPGAARLHFNPAQPRDMLGRWTASNELPGASPLEALTGGQRMSPIEMMLMAYLAERLNSGAPAPRPQLTAPPAPAMSAVDDDDEADDFAGWNWS